MRKLKPKLRAMKRNNALQGWGLLTFLICEYLDITKEGKLQLGGENGNSK